MSAHRQHTLDIPAPRHETPPQDNHADSDPPLLTPALLFVIVAFAISFLVSLAINGTPPQINRIERAPAMVTDLPSVDELRARDVQARLEDWRAGYEAAVQNGCATKPMLGAPLSKRP